MIEIKPKEKNISMPKNWNWSAKF